MRRNRSFHPSKKATSAFTTATLKTCLIAAMASMVPCDLRTMGAAAGNVPPEKTWNFDEAAPGALPGAFTVGTLDNRRPAGEWKILITDRARSPSQVLAQMMAKGADQADKLVLIEDSTSSNVDLEVSFLSVSGKTDMGGGLIWRANDYRNYYLLRASAVEQNIRLYRVVKGVRQVVKNHSHSIEQQEWHTLRVIQHGCEAQVRFDNEPIFQLCDQTFQKGRIGLWTKADAVTYFDDLQLRLLD